MKRNGRRRRQLCVLLLLTIVLGAGAPVYAASAAGAEVAGSGDAMPVYAMSEAANSISVYAMGEAANSIAVYAMGEAANGISVYATRDTASGGSDAAHRDSPLYGKRVLFCGDSICAATKYDDRDKKGWGWAGRIARDYAMTYVNSGKDSAAVSTARGGNTILAQLMAEQRQAHTFDFVILQGGVNDGWDNAPVGTVSDATGFSAFDDSTFAGALEKLFCHARMYYPQAKLGYIITYRTPSDHGTLRDMSAYCAAAKEICKKWDVECLDLYNDVNFNKRVLMPESGAYIIDGVHPNGAGYDRIYPKVAEFMEDMLRSDPTPEAYILAAAALFSECWVRL